MAKKRKSVATSLDEVDRSMYTSFCSAANSLSQLYTQAMNHQKLSFQAGERHGLVNNDWWWKNVTVIADVDDGICLRNHSENKPPTVHSLFEKLYQWIWRQEEEGSRVTTVDILNYLQNELDYGGEEPSMSPRTQVRHQHLQPTTQFTNSGVQVSSGSSGQITGQGTRSEQCDQPSKNSVFSNALSSPIRRSLQHYHIAQGGGFYQTGGLAPAAGGRNNDPNFPQHQNRDSNPPSSNDSSMDMHAD